MSSLWRFLFCCSLFEGCWRISRIPKPSCTLLTADQSPLYLQLTGWRKRGVTFQLYRRCDLWRHSKTITWFARIPPACKTFVFRQPARKWMQSYHDYASSCPAKHDVYSVLSTEGGLNVKIGHIVYTLVQGHSMGQCVWGRLQVQNNLEKNSLDDNNLVILVSNKTK